VAAPGVIKYLDHPIHPTMRNTLKTYTVDNVIEIGYNDLARRISRMQPGDTMSITAGFKRNPALDTIAPENRLEPADALQLTHVLKSKTEA